MHDRHVIHAHRCFDGSSLLPDACSILLDNGRITHLIPGPLRREAWPAAWRDEAVPVQRCAFLMPGLVDAHVHLFLDGDEDDLERRKTHMASDTTALLACGRRNLDQHLAAGITLVRDCGDKHGINQTLRAACAADHRRPWPQIVSAGCGIRAANRYGSFFADAWDPDQDGDQLDALVGTADLVKLVLSGIIDFAGAQVKGQPQFDLPTLTTIVAAAHRLGLPTTAHCSGDDAIELAIAAGLGGIEHGFFMRPDQVRRLAAKQACWCPTWTPVDVMRRRPGLLGLEQDSIDGIDRILDAHLDRLAEAPAAGLRVLPGTDAGSLGVPHGRSLREECRALALAGWSQEAILRAVCHDARAAWGLPGGRIAVGERLDAAAFPALPDRDFMALERASLVWVAGCQVHAVSDPQLAVAS